MLMVSADPSPLVQMLVYMAGILGGYILLTDADDWQRAAELVRSIFRTDHQDP